MRRNFVKMFLECRRLNDISLRWRFFKKRMAKTSKLSANRRPVHGIDV